MSTLKLQHLFGILLAMLCIGAIPLQSHAATKAKSKAVQSEKERLVLMPLRLGEEDQSRQAAMEVALLEGLQQKYEVFSGEQVAKKAREIFMKESKNTTRKECDETRCLQGIAEAFQAELLAVASVSKQKDGYFLAINIQNIFDNKVVYSKSVPCQNCNAYQVVEKLKELGGVPAPVAAAQIDEAQQSIDNRNDPENSLWAEVQRGNSADDYGAYLSQYPKGKYVALAKIRLKKLNEQAASELAQQDQTAWDGASNIASESSYQGYLNNYPQGRYAALAQARIAKLKKEAAQEQRAVIQAAPVDELAQQEKSLWESANSNATKSSYQDYLQQYPKGRYSNLAREQIRKLNDFDLAMQEKQEQQLWQQVLIKENSENIHVVQSYLDKYPNGRHSADAKKRLASIRSAYEAQQKRDAEIEMVEIPAGSFDMVKSKPYIKNPRHVIFSHPFEMAKTEVTQAQWFTIMGSYPEHFYIRSAQHPVDNVSWDDVKVFIQKLNAKTGKNYRLPSEAEWEYACRAGGQHQFCGSDDADSVAWYRAVESVNIPNSSERLTTHRVASKQPNAFGLYDMSGNVNEWVEDSHHEDTNYNGAPLDGSVWQRDGTWRILRGGMWVSKKSDVSAGARVGAPSSAPIAGFRLARTLQ